jgi:hypothetical protein
MTMSSAAVVQVRACLACLACPSPLLTLCSPHAGERASCRSSPPTSLIHLIHFVLLDELTGAAVDAATVLAAAVSAAVAPSPPPPCRRHQHHHRAADLACRPRRRPTTHRPRRRP